MNAVIIAAVLLALVAGYLFGTERERDRWKARTGFVAPTRPTAPANPVLSDREWECFVVAIYTLADGGDQP